MGRTVISGLKADGGGKSGGKITDPENGKTYRLTGTLSGNSLKLKVTYPPRLNLEEKKATIKIAHLIKSHTMRAFLLWSFKL